MGPRFTRPAKQFAIGSGSSATEAGPMKQMTFAAMGFGRYAMTTRKAAFLAGMEKVVAWTQLCALIEPHSSKAGNGRPPIALERMLRIYFLQQWFNLSDPAAEEALYNRAARAPRSNTPSA